MAGVLLPKVTARPELAVALRVELPPAKPLAGLAARPVIA
jgi:hypothetical protein